MTSPADVRWDAGSYGANTAHHRVFDDELLDSLGLRGDERVLDLGCGVGDLSARIARAVPHGVVVGVDADPDMVRAAGSRAAANLRFEHVPAQRIAERFPAGSFDVVVSVAVLHWVPVADQPGVAAGIRHVLVPGGHFRADFGGEGQIAAARALLDPLAVRHGGRPAPWYFPTVDQYRSVLEAAGLDTAPPGWITRREQRRPFNTATVLTWLASQVSIAYLPSLPDASHQAFLAAVDDEVAPALRRPDGTFDQDYVRIDLSARSRKP